MILLTSLINILPIKRTIKEFDQYERNFQIFLLPIDFESNNVEILVSNKETNNLEENTLLADKKYLQLKVRRDELIDVLFNRKPWEDLSIGFQCRVYRNPNIYNARFWFYFSNV